MIRAVAKKAGIIDMKALKLATSPAALCFWAICLVVGYSVVSSNASRVVAFKQESRFGYAKTSFPLHMKRWDEALFRHSRRAGEKRDGRILKNAEQDANAKPIEGEWKPYTETVSLYRAVPDLFAGEVTLRLRP